MDDVRGEGGDIEEARVDEGEGGVDGEDLEAVEVVDPLVWSHVSGVDQLLFFTAQVGER